MRGICGGSTGSPLNDDDQITNNNRDDGVEEEEDDQSVHSNLDGTSENLYVDCEEEEDNENEVNEPMLLVPEVADHG